MLDCVICLRETLPTSLPLTTLLCSHSFCQDCISCWLAISNKCPLCTSTVSDTLIFKPQQQQQQHPPSVDFAYSLSFVQKKLKMLCKLVRNKVEKSQNVKSSVSRVDAVRYEEEYKETEELVGVLEMLVMEGGGNGEVAVLLETINFKLMDLENELEGRGGGNGRGGREQKWVMEEDYEEEFPEIEQQKYEKFERKHEGKGGRVKKQKVK